MSESGWVWSQQYILMLNFLQKVKKLKETNAESNQVKIILELHIRQLMAYSKTVRERSMSQ